MRKYAYRTKQNVFNRFHILIYKIIVRVIYSGMFKGRQARHLPRAPFATVMCKVAYLAFKWGPTATAMYKWATLLSRGPKYGNCNALFFQRAP